MHDKSIPEELKQDRDSIDFCKNGVESLKPCCECECNNNGPAATQNTKQSSYSDLRSSLTNGANRVTFELPNEETESDVFGPLSQVSDMSIFGENPSATKMPPTSIARRRGASLTLDLRDTVEKPAPTRNISVPIENDLSHIAASELEMNQLSNQISPGVNFDLVLETNSSGTEVTTSGVTDFHPVELNLLSRLQEYEIDKNEHVDKNFVAETERVVRSFMISSYERETEKPLALPQDEEVSPDIPSPDETPIIPELFDQASVQDNNAAILMIARRLSFISAQMDARYGAQLDGMVVQILPNILMATDAVLDHAYHVFQHVASKLVMFFLEYNFVKLATITTLSLFRDGQITWCRIIALLSFGYRLGVALFRHGVNHFVHFVVKLVTKFIVNEHIYRWIIQRGGWFATLTYYLVSSGSFDTTTNFFFYSIWGITIFTVTCFALRHLAK